MNLTRALPRSLLTTLALTALTPSAASAQTVSLVTSSPALRTQLAAIRSSTGVPAVAAAIVVDGVVYYAVVGVRRADLPATGTNLVAASDEFCLGSVSKPYTAVALARAAELNLLPWNTTIGSVFPGYFPNTVTGNRYRDNTVAQLAAHASGMWYSPAGQPVGDEFSLPLGDDTRRLLYTINALRDPPVFATEGGSNYDGGAIIAAAMYEARNPQTFAQLMAERVFTPLAMSQSHAIVDRSSALSTWLGSPTLLPHQKAANGSYTPQSYSHGIRWMVGGVHSSIVDMARFGYMAMYAPTPLPHLYGSAQRTLLATAVGRGSYSPGWAVGSSDAAHGVELYHNGDDGRSHATMRVWPNRRVAIVTAVNASSAEATSACNQAEAWLMGHLADFGVSATPDADVIDNAVTRTTPVTVTASSNSGSAPLVTDASYSTGWTASAAGVVSTITIAPTSGVLPPFSRIFLDEGAPVQPPGFTSPPAWQIGGGGIRTFPISQVTVVAYAGGVGTVIANSDHAGRRRTISFPTQTNVTRVVVTVQSTFAPASLRAVHLLRPITIPLFPL